MKKLLSSFFTIIFVSIFFVLMTTSVSAQEKLNITLFYGEGCPHCEAASKFFNQLIPTYDQEKLSYQELEVYNNKENNQQMVKIAQEKGIDRLGVPFIVIGDDFVLGYHRDETTGKEIQEIVSRGLETLEEFEVATVAGEVKTGEEELEALIKDNDKSVQEVEKEEVINVPFIGEVNPKDVSLPLLTILIAAIDGFNPCAMWTLLFLISLLLGMCDRKRMWILGVTFIVTSALVYFFFLAAWFNFFYFFSYVSWIKIAIGLLALGTGTYYLRDFVVNKEGACKVSDNENKKKVFEKLKYFAQNKRILFALLGIIGLAFAVNLVELVCSAGLPAIYTNILSLSDLETWKYYSYLVLYIVIFMLDDLFVFVVAMVSLKAIGTEGKYARFSHLIGGILLFLIGIILLVKPELLMMG